jgi:glycosyltransferase involved in cell wall biosynthesis
VKVSIITVVLNNKNYIEDCIKSVLEQTYCPLEYIIVDGGSTDGTVQIIEKYTGAISRWISEPDQGIYDAMNKGIRLATGNIIGLLNADDFYADQDAVTDIINEFRSKKVDSVFADLVYVKRDNPDKVVRQYRSCNFHPDKFAYGWMPAHPTFFAKRLCYERYGFFKIDYKIAADYELLVRFLSKHSVSFSYIPRVIVKMRTGGVSTKNIKSNWILNAEIIRACRENGIETNFFKVFSKYFVKSFQLINCPK